MFLLKSPSGGVHGGVVKDLDARYPAWMAWPGVGFLQVSNIVIYLLLLVASITFDACGRDLAVYWYSNLIAFLEGSDLVV